MRKSVIFYFICAAALAAYQLTLDKSTAPQPPDEETARVTASIKSEGVFKLPQEDSPQVNEPHSDARHNQKASLTGEPSNALNTAEDRERTLRDLAMTNPNLAAQIALDAPANLQLKYLSIVIETWAHDDFDAAWAWSAHAGENAFYIRKILIATLSASAPEKIANLTKQWSASKPQQASDIYDMAIFSLAETNNFELAAQLAEQNPLPEDDRASVLRSIANDWADQNPDEAAQWALQKEGETNAIALTAVVDRWINNSPLHAAEFVKQLPDSNQRSELMQEVFSRWLAMDESGAKAWSSANGFIANLNTNGF